MSAPVYALYNRHVYVYYGLGSLLGLQSVLVLISFGLSFNSPHTPLLCDFITRTPRSFIVVAYVFECASYLLCCLQQVKCMLVSYSSHHTGSYFGPILSGGVANSSNRGSDGQRRMYSVWCNLWYFFLSHFSSFFHSRKPDNVHSIIVSYPAL